MSETLSVEKRARGAQGRARTVLVLAFDSARPLAAPEVFAVENAVTISLGRGDARSATRDGERLHLAIADAWMSGDHAVLSRQGDGWTISDRQSKNGTFVNGARIHEGPLQEGDVIETGGTMLILRSQTTPTLDPRPAFRTLMPELATELGTLERVARARVPVLLSGETGTGKELLARAMHEASARRGPFVAVNCGSLPVTLIESELFGAKKGAFSGAVADRPGLILTAHGGTLFLDEIAELPPPAQAALLRALQEGEVRPLGATETSKVDVRVIGATHEDLAERVAEGRFRRDLYARLRGYRFELPPLRERRDDLGFLIAELLSRIDAARAARIRFAPDASRALFSYGWPLNIRELEQVLRLACAVNLDGEVTVGDLPPELREPPPVEQSHDDRDRFLSVVRAHRANVTAIARALGTSRSQVRRIAARLGIDLASERTS